MADGRMSMIKEFLNRLKSLAPAEKPLSELAKKVRRLKKRITRGGSVKHRMAQRARESFRAKQ